CGGLEPCAADRAFSAVFLRLGRARLHEANLAPAPRSRRTRQAWACGHRARHGRRPRRARPLGRDAAQSQMSEPEKPDPKQRLVKVTLDEGSIGRSSPDIEHERAVAIYDLLEDNS